MLRANDLGRWTEFIIEEHLSHADVHQIAGRLAYVIGVEGHGYLMENMYMLSSNPVISQAEKLVSGLFCFYVEGTGYIYMKNGRVVVWDA